MFTFTLAFFAGHRYFSLHFQILFALCGKRKKEFGRKHSQRKPLTTTTTCIRRKVSNWSLCLLCSILSTFLKENAFWRKLMNYKPENRIPSLFTDFDNIKDLTWLFEKFPDVSLTVATLISERDRKFSGRGLPKSVAYKPSLPPLIATTPSPIQL